MKKLFILLSLFLILGCETICPSLYVYRDLKEKNTETLILYVACSDGPNFAPTKPGCDLPKLKDSMAEVFRLAEITISKDVSQSPPYIIYLETSILYFRASGGTEGSSYVRAEQVARQFFEVQKSSGGSSMPDARFYLAYLTSAHASFQLLYVPEELTAERKPDLVLAEGAGVAALPDIQAERKMRLVDALLVLENIIKQIP